MLVAMACSGAVSIRTAAAMLVAMAKKGLTASSALSDCRRKSVRNVDLDSDPDLEKVVS
jgi:hypothetical protein